MNLSRTAADLWPEAYARVIHSALLDRLNLMAYDAPEARLYCAILVSAAEDIAAYELHHPLHQAAIEYLDSERMEEHCFLAGLCVHHARCAVLGAGAVVGEVRRQGDRQSSMAL